MSSLQENIQQAVADFDGIKAAIEAKGVPVGEIPTSQYGEKINRILGGDISVIRAFIERSFTELAIPEGTTQIANGVFNGYTDLSSITIPDSVTAIGSQSFAGSGITEINLPPSVVQIGSQVFQGCPSLEKVVFNTGSMQFSGSNGYMFYNCSKLKEIHNVPNFTGNGNPMGYFMTYSSNIEYLSVVKNFNTNGLNLSSSNKFTSETLVEILENLADRTGLASGYYITLGTANLEKLTEEQIAIATNKNWAIG